MGVALLMVVCLLVVVWFLVTNFNMAFCIVAIVPVLLVFEKIAEFLDRRIRHRREAEFSPTMFMALNMAPFPEEDSQGSRHGNTNETYPEENSQETWDRSNNDPERFLNYNDDGFESPPDRSSNPDEG